MPRRQFKPDCTFDWTEVFSDDHLNRQSPDAHIRRAGEPIRPPAVGRLRYIFLFASAVLSHLFFLARWRMSQLVWPAHRKPSPDPKHHRETCPPGTSPFEMLPRELLEQIGDYVPLEDYYSLRLTSSSMERGLFSQFRARFFAWPAGRYGGWTGGWLDMKLTKATHPDNTAWSNLSSASYPVLEMFVMRMSLAPGADFMPPHNLPSPAQLPWNQDEMGTDERVEWVRQHHIDRKFAPTGMQLPAVGRMVCRLGLQGVSLPAHILLDFLVRNGQITDFAAHYVNLIECRSCVEFDQLSSSSFPSVILPGVRDGGRRPAGGKEEHEKTSLLPAVIGDGCRDAWDAVCATIATHDIGRRLFCIAYPVLTVFGPGDGWEQDNDDDYDSDGIGQRCVQFWFDYPGTTRRDLKELIRPGDISSQKHHVMPEPYKSGVRRVREEAFMRSDLYQSRWLAYMMETRRLIDIKESRRRRCVGLSGMRKGNQKSEGLESD